MARGEEVKRETHSSGDVKSSERGLVNDKKTFSSRTIDGSDFVTVRSRVSSSIA